ncbi:MAG: restriction endonuclease [Deltaproteobacteria bacterium]|uniref:Restriction endonuclease n=1 Tax=Candidatus Zymogenus saltonus TaxID=2844893 RepID=A0A9D8PPG3_9DELT|nr:restriction endonuclease [Candidatus Zymogenus saltonus]
MVENFSEFKNKIATKDGDWIIKGFIDVYRNIYTVSLDTKVLSKIIEIILLPIISSFAKRNNFEIIFTEHQNHYPDITFLSNEGEKYAIDLKSTYRISNQLVNGFTLGAFTGYFRHRNSKKNIVFPYNDYSEHFVLGIVYERIEEIVNEEMTYKLEDIENILSVIRNFTFLFQEKWKIASDHPGSGNTKNIGSVKEIEILKEGKSPFVKYGKRTFDDYWMNYLTKDMARAIDSDIPYRNLNEYLKWRNFQIT